MGKSFQAGYLLLLLASLATGDANAQENRYGAAIADSIAAKLPIENNAAGQPVRTEAGPVNYSKQEWQEAGQAPPIATRQAADSVHTPQAKMMALAAAPESPEPATAKWTFAAMGTSIGESGILTATKGDCTEIYAAGSQGGFGENTYWYALCYSKDTKQFQQRFVSQQFAQYIRRIALARVAGRSAPLIIVALGNGTIVQYDQANKALLSKSSGPCKSHGGLQTLVTRDLNGDGTDEFISSCEDQTLIVNGTGYTTWSLPDVGGADLATGQMDDDPAIEIASTSGQIIDTNTHAVQWQNPDKFGAHLQAADIDADGRDELIVAEGWQLMWAYDIERKLPKWSIPTDQDIGAIQVLDIDGDGVKELLMGDGQWGDVHAFNTQTLAEEWAINNPEHGVTNIVVADIDGDGVSEVLWGAGATSSGSDYFYAGDWHSRTIVAQTQQLDGPFIGPQVGDLDGDGIAEIVVASFSSESGYDSGRIVVIDSQTRQVRAISTGIAGGVYGWTGIHDLKLRDVNGDGRPEIVVAGDWLYDGLIEAYSFSKANQFSLVWTNKTRPEGAPFNSVDVADIDGDGKLEVLGGVGREHTGAEGIYVYAYDVASGAEEWHTLQMGSLYWSAVTDLAIADLDADGDLDFAGLVEGGNVYVFDGPTHRLDAIIYTEGTSLVAKSGTPAKLMIGDASGLMTQHAYDGTGYSEVSKANYGAAALDGLHSLPDGSLWVGSKDKLKRYQNGVKTFSTANYGTGFGSELATLPNKPRWIFSAGAFGVHGFKLPP